MANGQKMAIRILAVEDENNWRTMFKNSFRKPVYELQITDDIDEAENLIRQTDIAVVNINLISGIDLDESGKVFLAYIQDYYDHIPRIVVSGKGGYSVNEMTEAFIKGLGVYDVLIKPFRMDNLIKAMNNAINKSSHGNPPEDIRKKRRAMINDPLENSVKILHLSDLHISGNADPESMIQPLFADLEDRAEGLGIRELDYMIITGDLTNDAHKAEFEKAARFVRELKERYNVTDNRCVITPGNHDLNWDEEVYEWKKRRKVDMASLEPGRYIEQGDGILIRKDAEYPRRFRNFSEYLYRPVTQNEYPLSYKEQSLPFLFADHGILMMAMNSAWEIDEYFRDRSGIHDGALSRGMLTADTLIRKAENAGTLAKDIPLLKIAVWHHPVTGNEKIENDAFLERLRQADFRLCLHGHVHEDRTDLVGYLHPTRKIHISGAGSFDAPGSDRPEAIPRLYNLLEISSDHSLVRIHTRCRRSGTGAWTGWAVWPGERHAKQTYYDIEFSVFQSDRKNSRNKRKPETAKHSENTVNASSESEVFISYARGGESEKMADQLDQALREKGILIVRDKRDLGFKGRIREFMERIGRGRCVIVVISEKYLKSENCMSELVQIAENGDFYDRIFPIVLEDAGICKPVERIRYVGHWEKQIRDLDEAMKGVSAANLQGFREDIDLYTKIRHTIAKLTDILKDMNPLMPEIHSDSGFDELIRAIERKIAE